MNYLFVYFVCKMAGPKKPDNTINSGNKTMYDN